MQAMFVSAIVCWTDLLSPSFGAPEAWRSRPLDAVKYLILDARYCRCGTRAVFAIAPLLTTIEIASAIHRSALRCRVSLSGRQVRWREFLKSLLARCLDGLELIVSDSLSPNHASLLRLTTAILIEVSEEWETGKRYVTF